MEPRDRTLPGDLLRSPWIWAGLIGILVLAALGPLLTRASPPLPVLGNVGAFSLVDSDGRAFGAEQLKGTATIVSFFFTRCPSMCPLLMHTVKGVQDEIGASGERGVRLLSVTADPEYDTPARLRDYGKALGVDPAHWVLATGDPAEIRRVATVGFHVAIGDSAPAAGPGLLDIAHTGKLVLVDPQGAIRGYYDTDSKGLEEVWSRAREVSRETAR